MEFCLPFGNLSNSIWSARNRAELNPFSKHVKEILMGRSLFKDKEIWEGIDDIIDEYLNKAQAKGEQITERVKEKLFDNSIYPEIEERLLEEFEYAVHDEDWDDVDEESTNEDLIYQRYCSKFDKKFAAIQRKS
jgi:hypothetical protein